MLFLRQFAFPHNALMLFVCAPEAVFELLPIVRQLFGHFVGSTRHIATGSAQNIHDFANLEFMRRHRISNPISGPGPRSVTQSEMSKWAVILLLVHRSFFDFNQTTIVPFNFLQHLLCVRRR
jgi:hypothetical protein